MNILFLTVTRITDIRERGIYTDLMREFRDQGHKIYIAAPSERRYREKTGLRIQDDITILNVKSLNIQKTNLLEKGVGTVLLEYQFAKAINFYYSKTKFDLILYSTPPITFSRVIKMIKSRDGAVSYLLLKDIFPQNAVDLGIIRKGGILHRFFIKKEKELYGISDFIGCMSQANMQYIIDHNPQLDPKIIEVNPNSIQPVERKDSCSSTNMIRARYSVPANATVFVYGGNLGKPQGLEFLIDVLTSNLSNANIFFLIIGTGTEYQKLSDWFVRNTPDNALLISALPKVEYDELLNSCDVGLLFLDKRFTIPNFPSRMLSYMEYKMPIIAATDRNTDVGEIIEKNGFGYWCENGNLQKFNELINRFEQNGSKVNDMGKSGYDFMINNYLVVYSYEKIIKHFQNV